MNKEEILKKFEKNVDYLTRNIAPDDIYMFCEQTFMAAMYFLSKLSEHIDIKEEAAQDKIFKKWVTNLMVLKIFQENNEEINLDLDMDKLEEDDDEDCN